MRLKCCDYSAPGTYFITICTSGKRCVLSAITVGDGLARPVVKLTNIGRIVERQIEAIPQRFPSVTVDKYVIMPNHVHLLISLQGNACLGGSPIAPGEAGGASPSPTVGDVIGALKSLCAHQARPCSGDRPLWQRSYYDHVVRGERDYGEIWAYMEYNPLRWAEDDLFRED